jgi:putative transposase
MEGYKRGSHTVWDCKYHVVWTTKYRFAVPGGDVGDRCRESRAVQCLKGRSSHKLLSEFGVLRKFSFNSVP